MSNYTFAFPNTYYYPTSSSSAWAGSAAFGTRSPSTTNGQPPPYTYGQYSVPWFNCTNPFYFGPPRPQAPMHDFGQAGARNGFYGGFGGSAFAGGAGGGPNPDSDSTSTDVKGQDFEVKVNVSKYKPEDLSVKTVNNTTIIVEGNKQSQGEHSSSSRVFSQRYNLPSGIPPENLTCRLTPDGYLVLSAKRPKGDKEAANSTGQNVDITKS